MSPKVEKVEKALAVLEENIAFICTVEEWAERMGYDSAKYFSRLFRNHYAVRPKEVLVDRKLQRFREFVESSPHAIHYEIANELGFRDEASLYKFVKRHTGKSPSEWKKQIGKRDRKKGKRKNMHLNQINIFFCEVIKLTILIMNPKILLGTFLLLASALVFYFNTNLKLNQAKEEEDFFLLPYTIGDGFIELNRNPDDSLITIVALLSTDMCSSCVTNIKEFDELLADYNKFSQTLVFFINTNLTEVNRFVNITNLDMEYFLLDKNEIDPYFSKEKQRLIAIDNVTRQVFYDIRIPSSHTSVSQKKYTIDKILSLQPN